MNAIQRNDDMKTFVLSTSSPAVPNTVCAGVKAAVAAVAIPKILDMASRTAFVRSPGLESVDRVHLYCPTATRDKFSLEVSCIGEGEE